MNYDDIQKLLKFMVEEAFKQHVSTPQLHHQQPVAWIEEAFKKVGTPYLFSIVNMVKVEEAFKQEIMI